MGLSVVVADMLCAVEVAQSVIEVRLNDVSIAGKMTEVLSTTLS